MIQPAIWSRRDGRPKLRDGSHGKKQDGKNVFEEAAKGFDEQFQQAAEDALDEVINKL